MTFFNFLLSQLQRHHLQPTLVSGFTQYDEDGYPIEESEWSGDEIEDEDEGEDILHEEDLHLGDDEEL